MEIAQERIERLVQLGKLNPIMARMDLRTLRFLATHPDRRYPESAGDWFGEVFRFFHFLDPGVLRLLRINLLSGAMPTSGVARRVLACSVVAGLSWSLLFYVGTLLVEVIAIGTMGGTVHKLFQIATVMAPVCTLCGLVFAAFIWVDAGRAARTLAKDLNQLDSTKV